MVESGEISVTCEFCSSKYVFAPEEVGARHPGAGLTSASGRRSPRTTGLRAGGKNWQTTFPGPALA